MSCEFKHLHLKLKICIDATHPALHLIANDISTLLFSKVGVLSAAWNSANEKMCNNLHN
jgi:hypothetical protein